jgi:hypothetical protein
MSKKHEEDEKTRDNMVNVRNRQLQEVIYVFYPSVPKSFWSHYGPGVDSAYNRNEYQVYFLGVKAAGT